MSKGFPAYRPIPQFVVDELFKKSTNYSLSFSQRLNAWIRISGNSGNGLVLQSNPPVKLVGENSIYGNSSESGIVGLNWDGEPVKGVSTEYPRGYRPSPVIQGLNLKDLNYGVSRECSFTITAYSIGQVNEIQKYFGEPSHTVLVEFGWDLENAHKELITLNPTEIAKVGLDFSYLLQKRKNSNGNYNAMLGFITGFKVGSSGETYDLEVTIKGMGQMPPTMMIQKPIVKRSNNPRKQSTSSLLYMPGFIAEEKDAGIQNFRYMCNLLPSHKQIQSIKKLESKYGKEENFINFNPETFKYLKGESDSYWFNNNVKTKKGKLAIPKGGTILTEEKFIRFSLLKKIIDTNDHMDVEKGFDVGGKSYPMKIFTEFTVCSGFDKMFSTDKNVLVVPNTNVPDFGYVSFLEGDDQTINTEQQGVNDCSQKDASGNTAVQFPQPNELAATKDSKTGHESLQRDARQWGYIDDLYVNFNYAMDIINEEQATYRDTILKIANGLSSAVNSIWRFDIVESPAPENIIGDDGSLLVKEGDLCLQLVDLKCTSQNKPTASDFVHSGANSVFLNGTLDIDLPGDMASSIITSRKAQDGSQDSDEVDSDGDKDERETNIAVFKSTLEDKVLTAYNKKNSKNNDDASKGTSATKDSDKTDEDLAADLYQKFADKIGAYPRAKTGDINLDKVNLEDAIMFPCYDDEMLFKRLFKEDNPNYKSDGSIKGVGPLMGMIKYNFAVHGNSGFVHGDTFNVKGIPEKYRKNGMFTITNIEHNIDGMFWTSEISGEFRPTK